MNPRPMTNDPDRVAPDHPIHLPGPTPVRPRRPIAAGVLSVLLGLSCFAASPTWAYKAGRGADDTPYNIFTNYDSANEYIAARSKHTNDLYVIIKGKVYRVRDLNARHTPENPLSDDNLPTPVDNDTFGTVAVGRGASASANGATSIGVDSAASSSATVAIGRTSRASGARSIALGAGSRAQGRFSMALGLQSLAQDVSSTALGHGSRALGAQSTAVGYDAGANGVGSIAVGYRALAGNMNSIALGRGASVIGDKGIAIGWKASAGANEVVIGTKGDATTSRSTYKLPGLAAPTGTTRVVTVDSNGRLSTQPTTAGTASSRGAALRGAAELSSDVTAVNRTEAADYEEAPAIGSGPGAPATAEQRRVVVQDTNRDGSVRLRTLDLGDLSGLDRRLAGVDQRVSSLSERLNKATAMSSALSALPNVVPGDNRFFLGVGAGHYSSEQAFAVGMSARIESRVFVNAGVALASGDEVSVRGGVGVVW